MIGKIKINRPKVDDEIKRCRRCLKHLNEDNYHSLPAYDYDRTVDGSFHFCPPCYDKQLQWARPKLPEGHDIFIVVYKGEDYYYHRPYKSTWRPDRVDPSEFQDGG